MSAPIALDAMGGDHAPGEIVRGALGAAERLGRGVFLVGDPAAIAPFVPPEGLPPGVEIVPARESVAMDEKPLDAYRKKKDSSLMVCARLVREGRASAMVSAGNTGAAAAHALLTWRPVEGIRRPAIASFMPNAHDGFILLDAGASPDVDPSHLVEFARMGRAYAELLLGRRDVGVHLLNIGQEAGKGGAFAKEAHAALSDLPYFRGNIEGKAMFAEPCDVVVCEGFLGNVVLKTAEGVAELITDIIRREVPTSPLVRPLYWPVKKVTAPIRDKMDYAAVGGSPLLGLNGVCLIAHGRSDARAIENALLQTDRLVGMDVVGAIRAAGLEEDPAAGLQEARA